ncbi:hypothetical protein [Nocardioides sp. TF02-7]|uniref:hypothetical protein n=1 Tax=Nocardioides sp. TF02-7 TaxID=2917724 RepID=UPI001F05FBF7|nr:hypothetical protein [Nocardioides sp. TF02-7]UMG93989.1 hypothetical protein MF408_07875 [Nocardioides sp. TF02-7]
MAATGWALGHLLVITTDGSLPFDWPARSGADTAAVLVETNLALLQVLLLMSIVWWLTRRRTDLDVAARAPEHRRAVRETWGLLAYGAAGLLGGFLLARALGWHPFGLHLAGTIFGTHAHLDRAEVVAWALYNLVVYAVVPLAYFGRRYSTMALGLRSTCRRNDLLVVGVVLALETWFQIVVLQPESLDLPPGVLVRGAALTFVLYLLGAVLPAMVFVYAILIPRFLRVTGSAAATVLCGGLVYAGLHVWDAWTVLSSPRSAALSIAFLVFTYLGPGMIKSFLTLRTGNAWVHVWAYHAFAPHTLIDTPHIVQVFRMR